MEKRARVWADGVRLSADAAGRGHAFVRGRHGTLSRLFSEVRGSQILLDVILRGERDEIRNLSALGNPSERTCPGELHAGEQSKETNSPSLLQRVRIKRGTPYSWEPYERQKKKKKVHGSQEQAEL